MGKVISELKHEIAVKDEITRKCGDKSRSQWKIGGPVSVNVVVTSRRPDGKD